MSRTMTEDDNQSMITDEEMHGLDGLDEGLKKKGNALLDELNGTFSDINNEMNRITNE